MCQHRSYIVTESATVYSLIDSDSHTAIREKHSIRDSSPIHADRQASIELLPVDLFDPTTWTLHFDDPDGKPDWWTDAHEKAARLQLALDHRVFLRHGIYTFGGYLYLGRLTSLPANAKLSAGGYLNLGSLTSLPAGANVKAVQVFLKS